MDSHISACIQPGIAPLQLIRCLAQTKKGQDKVSRQLLGASELSGAENAESRELDSDNTAEQTNGRGSSNGRRRRTFAIPREFTNYDRNALTWRSGTALEIFERSAKSRPNEADK